ncbi:hypothetical protein chiPu_0021870 [Chiloscyllium punctatum]|uniref:Progestin and adipoQ receptor family member VI n=1 Tax=Chiloscyllium punctatum TaxID=137246 RepID=A0A401RE87_CHIPU|nr:hypothetical protein [Chiloscyllium punctatum]
MASLGDYWRWRLALRGRPLTVLSLVCCRYFLWRFLALSRSVDFYNEAYAWPLFVYMLVICLYPFISSCAHTFSTMSAHVRHVCYFLDYGALSLYSLGCAVSYRAYIMPDRWINSTLHCYFTHVAVFNSLVCTTLSCYSRFLEIEQPKLSKMLRITAFSLPFLFDNIPLFYRVRKPQTGYYSEGHRE